LDLAKDDVGEALWGMKWNFLKDTVALAERDTTELASRVKRKQTKTHGVSL
jgi:hypothetical protein